MALTEIAIRKAKHGPKPIKLADEKGMFLLLQPSGGKLWRLKYRFAGKESRIAHGAYPEVSLAEARKRRDAARAKLDEGIDPGLDRKRQKAVARVSAENSFERVPKEYLSKMEKEGRAGTTVTKARWFLTLLKPAIGTMLVSEVDPQMLLAALRKLEGKGNYETAKRPEASLVECSVLPL